MNKYDVQHEKIVQDAKRVELIVGAITLLIRSSAYLGAIWLIFNGIQEVVGGRSADSINAIAKVIAELKIGTILGYVWAAGATAIAIRERKGKKRMTSKKSDYQKRAERNDPSRTSSGLTKTGDTPVDGEEVDDCEVDEEET